MYYSNKNSTWTCFFDWTVQSLSETD